MTMRCARIRGPRGFFLLASRLPGPVIVAVIPLEELNDFRRLFEKQRD